MDTTANFWKSWDNSLSAEMRIGNSLIIGNRIGKMKSNANSLFIDLGILYLKIAPI